MKQFILLASIVLLLPHNTYSAENKTTLIVSEGSRETTGLLFMHINSRYALKNKTRAFLKKLPEKTTLTLANADTLDIIYFSRYLLETIGNFHLYISNNTSIDTTQKYLRFMKKIGYQSNGLVTKEAFYNAFNK